MNNNIVKILVCYHKPARLLKSKVFVPIHVGREVAFQNSKDGKINQVDYNWLIKNMIGDNTGDNISILNRNYCELTALYWAWKNKSLLNNPKYIGLMHYRRVIKFSNIYKNFYNVTEKDVLDIFNNSDIDVWLTNKKSCYSVVNKCTSKNVYEHFCREHGNRLTHIMLECIKEYYPEMKGSMDNIMFAQKKICWYNIFVAKWEIFDKYCEWLFSILERINSKCCEEGFDMESSRMMGYYGEILLNIYIDYANRNQELKIQYLDDVRLNEDDRNEIVSNTPKAFLKRKIKEIDKNGDLKNKLIFYMFLSKRKKKIREKYISTVHSMTYREFAPNGGKGGGAAVLSCQRILLQDSYRHLKLKYSFIEDNYYKNPSNELWDLWAAADFAYNKAINEKDTVYITHDYGTAFGLYLAGKRYVLVSHIQGARVEEKTNFGEIFTEYSAEIIKYCEKKAMENAELLCFPSYGAYIYLTESKYTTVDFKKVNLGPVLYNTLYVQPKGVEVPKIPEKKEFLTILSVGQLTTAKGMDRCITLIERILNLSNRKLRWICVGQGPLIGEIISRAVDLMKKNKNFIFSHVGGCSYVQMQYLQQISDVYMMLQRISIFDLATLEVMNKEKAIVLSSVGGNIEFNKENNIILFGDDYEATARKILEADLKALGQKNKKVYNKYFSNENFIHSYHYMIDLLAHITPERTIVPSSYYDYLNEELNNKITCLQQDINKHMELVNSIKVQSEKRNGLENSIEKQVEQKEKKYELYYPSINKTWRNGELIDDLLIDQLMNNDESWSKEVNQIWLVIACSLLERKDYYRLEKLLIRYISKHGEKDIYKYMPLSVYVCNDIKFDIKDELIKMSAAVFVRFNKSIKRNVIFNKLKNRTIAVVGNGPSEIGKGLGKEIDSHDIVIRFNNYSTEGFEEDYGTKTNIWVRGSGASDVINREVISNYDLVIFEGDYYHLPIIPKGHPEVLFDYLKQNTAMAYFDCQTHQTLKEYSGIEFPTSGLVTIWAIYLMKDAIRKLDVYGFAFRQEIQNGIATHYFNDRTAQVAEERSKVHSLDKESEIIIRLLEKINVK